MIPKIKRGIKKKKKNFKSNQYKLSKYTYKFVVVENERLEVFLAWLVVVQDSKTCMLDSCPHHMDPHRFHKCIPLIEPHSMYMGDGRTQQVVELAPS